MSEATPPSLGVLALRTAVAVAVAVVVYGVIFIAGGMLAGFAHQFIQDWAWIVSIWTGIGAVFGAVWVCDQVLKGYSRRTLAVLMFAGAAFNSVGQLMTYGWRSADIFLHLMMAATIVTAFFLLWSRQR